MYELVDVTEAARMLGLSKARIRQFCGEGRLGFKVGSRWIFTRAEIDQFASESRPLGRPPRRGEQYSVEGAHVYILQCGPYYKIGASAKVGQRISQLSALPPFDIELIHTIPTDDMYGLESELHTQFSDKRKRGEWFELDDSDVEYIKGLVGDRQDGEGES